MVMEKPRHGVPRRGFLVGRMPSAVKLEIAEAGAAREFIRAVRFAAVP